MAGHISDDINYLETIDLYSSNFTNNPCYCIVIEVSESVSNLKYRKSPR